MIAVYSSCRSTGVAIPQIVIGSHLKSSPGVVSGDDANVSENFCTIELKADNTMERFEVPLRAKIDGKFDGTQNRVIFLSLSTTGDQISRQSVAAYIPVSNVSCKFVTILLYIICD